MTITIEYKQKMSQIMKGRKFSIETIEKMSVSAKLRKERERMEKETNTCVAGGVAC